MKTRKLAWKDLRQMMNVKDLEKKGIPLVWISLELDSGERQV